MLSPTRRITSFLQLLQRFVERNQTLVVTTLTIVAALLIFRNYLLAGMLLYGDANFLWSSSQLHAELVQLLNIWRNQAGGISGPVTNATQSFVLLQAFFSPLGIPLSTVLVPAAMVAASFLAFRKLAYALDATGWAAAIAAAFYAGNPWFWDQLLAGHVAICAAVALAPLVLATLVGVYRAKPGSGWLLLALCALELLADSRIALFVFAAVFVAALVGGLRLRNMHRQHAPSFVAFSLLAPLLAVVANAWWTGMYAFARGADPVPSFYPPVEGVTVYSGSADFAHALVLSGYFIHFEWQRMQQLGWPVFALWYAAIVFLLVVPAVLAHPRTSRWIAAATLPLAFVASMGSYALPSSFLGWILVHVPLMALLREPVKYGFLLALGISTLTALWLSSATRRARIVAGIVVLIAIFPVLTGWLSVPDGHGLQIFSQRPAFLAVANYLRNHPGPQGYRVAFLPPWLTEQSLAKGEFYVANPFVFQSEIPEIDAKLINTSTPMDNAAWQAFYGLYWGTDAHPARTLGRFGIRYLIVSDDVTLSAGAQYTAFAGVPAAELHYLLARDPDFVQVYHRGAYWIYEDRDDSALVRNASAPVLNGHVAALVRQTLPYDALGDDIERIVGRRPPDTQTIASDPVSACVQAADFAGLRNAYLSVGRHADYTGYWVASDWMIRGPGDLDGRMLSRFALPYAFTRSASATVDVPIVASAASTLYAQLGSLSERSDLSVSVDGKALPPIDVGNAGFRWYSLMRVAAGRHLVSIRGNTAGTLASNVAAVTSNCSAPPALRGHRYFVSGPLAEIAARVGATTTTVATSAGKVLASFTTPPGAAATAIDGTPDRSGQPFAALRGIHTLNFYKPSGARISGRWQLESSIPYQVNPGSAIIPQTLQLQGGRWPQLADMTVADVQPGQYTMFQYSVASSIAGATLTVRNSDQSINTTFVLPASGTHDLLIPYQGNTCDVLVRVPGDSRGTITIEKAAVTGAVQVGDSQYFLIPAIAGTTSGALVPGSTIANYRMLGDGSLTSASGIMVPVRDSSHLRLTLTKLSASAPADVSVIAYYSMPFAGQQSHVVASVHVGPMAVGESIDLPVLPRALAVGFALAPSSNAAIRLAGATLHALPESAGGFTVVAPTRSAAGSSAIAYDQLSPEDLQVKGAPAGWVIGDFTYDPYWGASSGEHWKANGRENAWFESGATPITLHYTLQAVYQWLQLFAALFFVLTFAVWGARSLRARRN